MEMLMDCLIFGVFVFLAVAGFVAFVVLWAFIFAWWKGWMKGNPDMTLEEILTRTQKMLKDKYHKPVLKEWCLRCGEGYPLMTKHTCKKKDRRH